jgi:hypothetical protein
VKGFAYGGTGRRPGYASGWRDRPDPGTGPEPETGSGLGPLTGSGRGNGAGGRETRFVTHTTLSGAARSVSDVTLSGGASVVPCRPEHRHAARAAATHGMTRPPNFSCHPERSGLRGRGVEWVPRSQVDAQESTATRPEGTRSTRPSDGLAQGDVENEAAPSVIDGHLTGRPDELDAGPTGAVDRPMPVRIRGEVLTTLLPSAARRPF